MSDDRRPQDGGSVEIQPKDNLTTAAIAGAGAPRRDSNAQEARGGASQTQASAPLFPGSEAEELRTEWGKIQINFVDEPRTSVEQADGLVASAMQRLAEVFAKERSSLEAQWDRGENVSTEDLRVAMQRYRSFFERLLSM